MAEFDDYAWLIGAEAARLLGDFADDPRPLHQQNGALRKSLSAERARLVVQQVDLRRRGVAKFGGLAGQMFFLPTQLKQATDIWVARYKAVRFARAKPQADYCTGIGGDLLGLAEHGPVCGWERDPPVALMAGANLAALGDGASGSMVHVGDATDHPPTAGQQWHLDPDRRTGGSRSTRIESYSPGIDFIDAWLLQNPDGAVKLAPAATVPPTWSDACELEWITRGRECRQQVLWSGALAATSGQRRATRVIVDAQGGWSATSFVATPTTDAPSVDRPRAVVFDPDPSLVAAGLVGAAAEKHQLHSLGPGSVYLTGERVVDEPLLTGFALQAHLPLRVAAVAKHLRARGVGRVEIKVRGVKIDPHQFRGSLKLHGSEEAAVVLTRIGKRKTALVCQRIA